MTTYTPVLALCLTIFVFNIPRQRMSTIFKFPQSQISYHSRYGSDSLHFNKVIVGLCTQNRHIFNTSLCAQGFAHISTHSDGRQVVIPSYMCSNPIWTENFNMQTLWMQQSTSQKEKPTSFNKFVALYDTMPYLSETPFSLSSVTFLHSSLRTRRTHQKRWPSSWTF